MADPNQIEVISSSQGTTSSNVNVAYIENEGLATASTANNANNGSNEVAATTRSRPTMADPNQIEDISSSQGTTSSNVNVAYIENEGLATASTANNGSNEVAATTRSRLSKNERLHYNIAIAILSILLVPSVVLAILFGVLWGKSNGSTSSSSSSFTPIVDSQWNSVEVVDPAVSGQWETVIPSVPPSSSFGPIVGMQTVHSALLPSGKVILASGSSWRNNFSNAEVYPYVSQPSSGTGLFGFYENPFNLSKKESYYNLLNNVGIFDPQENTFFRIPHPLPSQTDPDDPTRFLPNDLFCTSHMHLRDGRVLFFGGTQLYYPFRSGAKTTYIFDWIKEVKIVWKNFDWTVMPEESSSFYPWIWAGYMKQGRWYAHAVPLFDGRLVIMGGFIGNDSLVPDMYPFEINTRVEFFDYTLFLANQSNPQAAWYDFNVLNYVHSPFTTMLPIWAPQAYPPCQQRQCEAYKRDAFTLYPQNYLLPDGRIYLTREGDFNSLRTVNVTCIRRSMFSYFLMVNGSFAKDTIVSFSPGPNRPDYGTMSGTTVLDPNTNNEAILLFGGMNVTTGGTMLPGLYPQYQEADNTPITPTANQYAGSRGSRKLEVYSLPNVTHKDGAWAMIDEEYLGEQNTDDRTMHYSIILPTKQILIINGGNYDFAAPVFYPLLLTPIYATSGTFTGRYNRTKLAPSPEPRLYHNIALLLTDGRILISGGNACRASVDASKPLSAWNSTTPNQQTPPNLDRVDLHLYFLTDSSIGTGFKVSPAENWVMEIFSPPYLFIDGTRRVAMESLTWIPQIGRDLYRANLYQLTSTVANYTQTYYLFHSGYQYHIFLSGLPLNSTCTSLTYNGDGSLVLMKLGSSTHGWDGGQKLYQLPFAYISSTSPTTAVVQFTAPQAKSINLVPAFYMLYYVDCRGKPSLSFMIRFDDEADSAV